MHSYTLMGNGKFITFLEEMLLDEECDKALVKAIPHNLLHKPHCLRKT